MNNKIQELTDKLYQEGLSKGKAEGEKILADAKAEAAHIKEQALSEAGAILEKARKEADELSAKAQADIKMASQQALLSTRRDIEEMVVTDISAPAVKGALQNPAFLKEIIRTVAEKFSAQEAGDLALVLPESLSAELEPFVGGELSKLLGRGVQASFSKKISGGFSIGPKDGGYFISMSDETFQELIAEYLRPVTRKLLFG